MLSDQVLETKAGASSGGLQSGSLVKILSEVSEGSPVPTELMARTLMTYFFSGLMPSSILNLSSLMGLLLTLSHFSSGRASATST